MHQGLMKLSAAFVLGLLEVTRIPSSQVFDGIMSAKVSE